MLGTARMRIVLALCGSMAVADANAQSGATYSITKSTIAGGGGISTSASYSVTGTAGQHDAGDPSGATYAITGGFWSPSVVVPPCTPSTEPTLATLQTPSGNPTYKTNRYLPVRIQDMDGVGRLIRVEALQLPAPYQGTVFEGQQWWAGQPFRVCEKANEPGGTSCSSVPGQPKGRRFNWYAPLVCDQSLAVPIKVGTCQSGTCSGGFADGDACGRDQDCQLLYLEQEGIVPSLSNRSAVYEVKVIGEDCVKTTPDNYSGPLTITQNRLGDFAGLGSQCETPVGGNGPGSEDINAITAKFSNLNCQVKKARCDITRVGGGAPDHKCDSVDINAVLTGFSNPTSLPWGPVDSNDACGQFGAAATEGIATGDLMPQEATVVNRPVQTTAGDR